MTEPLFSQLLRISAFTVFQALCSTAIALIVGVAAAFFTARRDFFGKRCLLSLSSVPFCIPTLLIALGFVSFFGMSGTLNTLLKTIFALDESPITFLYSFSGIIITQGFYNFPLVMSSVHDCWSQIPQEQAEAARLLGANDSRVFTTVTVHQLMPAIVSSCMLVFLYCYFSFMIVLLFGTIGCTTLEVEVYKAARVSLNFRYTVSLALVETTLACVFVGFYALLEQKSGRTRGLSFTQTTKRHAITAPSERFFAGILFTLILLFFIAPIASIVYNAFSSIKSLFTLNTLCHALSARGFSKALTTTILCALATAFFSVLIAFLYAVFARSRATNSDNLVLRIIPMMPMSISSVVLGIVITALVRRGNALLLVTAQVFLAWPLAFRQIYASLSKIPEETIDAARLFCANPLTRIRTMYLPSSLRGILSAAGFCFAVSAGDTSLPLVMAIPRFDTLSLFTYRLAGTYRFHEACAAGLILGMICAIVFALANRLKEK
ncbi:MAG: iron ABC transporter permease [Treponema sp.]|nr:iron ABC transporter permease [Treponema sp.]